MPYKLCPKCNAQNGVRSKECSCGQPFVVKTKRTPKHKLSDIEWTELKSGDVIKSVGSHGPWRPSEKGKIYMGEYGIIKVHMVAFDGIHGYNDKGSHCFLYMGKDYLSSTGTNMSAHKVQKVR